MDNCGAVVWTDNSIAEFFGCNTWRAQWHLGRAAIAGGTVSVPFSAAPPALADRRRTRPVPGGRSRVGPNVIPERGGTSSPTPTTSPRPTL